MFNDRAIRRGSVFLAMTFMGVLAAACAERISIHTATNPAASFDKYQTFSLGSAEGPPAGYRMSSRSAEVQRRLGPLIVAGLGQRGYAQASGKTDFFVKFGSGRRTVAVHEAGDAMGGGWLPDDENGDFVEGSLVIDAFDGTTGERVWHGASRAQIDPDHVDDALLQHSVAELLSSFPTFRLTSSWPPVAVSAAR